MKHSNEYMFYCYIITRSEGRIAENDKKINILKNSLNNDTEYQKCSKFIAEKRDKLSHLDKKLTDGDNRYQSLKSPISKVRCANQIQLLTESIYEKQDKMDILQLMIDQKIHSKSTSYFSIFPKYYKKVKAVNREELDDNTSRIKEFFHFCRIKHSISKNLRNHTNSNDSYLSRLYDLLKLYNKKVEYLMNNKSEKEEQLHGMTTFVYSYPTLKVDYEKEKYELEKQLSVLEKYMDQIMVERKKKEKELMRLETDNHNLNQQILQVSELKNQLEYQFSSTKGLQKKLAG